MNTTIDLKTAKTIEAMNQKINHMDNAVTDFFNKMSDVLERQLGDDEVYAAVIAPEIELTITRWRTFAVTCLASMKLIPATASAKMCRWHSATILVRSLRWLASVTCPVPLSLFATIPMAALLPLPPVTCT